eukprot:jgi/Picsp_1/2811/NSC_01037-R1_atp-binding cassette subfamily member group ath protein 4
MEGQHTDFGQQINASIRKNFNLQRRRWVGNLLLVVAPLLVSFSLLALQNLIVSQSSDSSFQCGCKCRSCCDWVESDTDKGAKYLTCFNATDESPCSPYAAFCLEQDDEQCGYLHSTVDQATFCEVKQPPLWPAIVQVPQEVFRASTEAGVSGELKPVHLMFTGENVTQASDIMSHFFPNRESISDNVARSYVKEMMIEDLSATEQDMQDSQAEISGAERDFLEMIGALTKGIYDFSLVLGTPAVTAGNLLIEPAFASTTRISSNMWPLYILQQDCSALSDKESLTISRLGYAISNLTGIAVQCLSTTLLSMKSAQAIDEAIYCGWYGSAGCQSQGVHSLMNESIFQNAPIQEFASAYDWRNSSDTNLNLQIWVNSSNMPLYLKLPDIQRYPKSVNLAVEAHIRTFYGDVSVSLAGVKDFPRSKSKLSLDFSSLFGPLFSMWLMQIILPLQVYAIVMEKQSHLRMMSYMQGLSPAAYYIGLTLIYFLLYLVCMSLFVGVGAAIGLNFFVKNSFSVQLVFYLVWGVTLLSFGLLFSSCFREKKSVTLASILYIIITGFVANVFLVQLIEQDITVLVALLQVIPSFALFRGLYELSQYAFLADQTGTDGITWSTISADPAMVGVIIVLSVEAIVFALFAFYWDHISGAVDGIPKSFLYLFKIRIGSNRRTDELSDRDDDDLLYYLGYQRHGYDTQDQMAVSRKGSSLELYLGNFNMGKRQDMGQIQPFQLGDDVIVEKQKASRIHYQWKKNPLSAISSEYCIILSDVMKSCEYSGSPFLSVKSLSLAISKHECFGFIGSNAGKTTIIRMMQGLVQPSSGSILINGFEVQDYCKNNRSRMGSCAQQDTLYYDLTIMEHLLFYARIKCESGFKIHQQVQETIEKLDLSSFANKQIKHCSGGVRRRLSFGIATLGSPSVIFLDEPSAGLDPYSRKILWESIKKTKKETTVIISTSNIQEAESLCDRIVILKEGISQCIGSPKELISRYGSYLWVSFFSLPSEQDTVKKFIRSTFQGSELLYEIGGRQKFGLPTQQNEIDTVFRKVERARLDNRINVVDWSISSATLEDVYLNLIE